MSIQHPLSAQPRPGNEFATLAGGCFWCLEAVFEDVEGVVDVESGYTGGNSERPSYRQVCEGTTGHAEVVRIEFDPARISYRELLEIFFSIHDPTTLNRQGNDVGTQYRSAIYFTHPNSVAWPRTSFANCSRTSSIRSSLKSPMPARTGGPRTTTRSTSATIRHRATACSSSRPRW